jgi:hypothetical protein
VLKKYAEQALDRDPIMSRKPTTPHILGGGSSITFSIKDVDKELLWIYLLISGVACGWG